MAYIPTKSDFDVLRQKDKEIYLKIELLNKSYKVIDIITGNPLSDSLSIDGSALQRRTYNCDLHVIDSSFLIGDDKKIWIDKYIRIYYGIKSMRKQEILWCLIGTFTFLDANYHYSSTTNTLSLSCGDLMADYDGTKNGEIDGYSLTVPAGENIRSSIIALVKEAGITKYIIEDINKEIPYDLEFTDSKTYCDVWIKIRDLYDSWEFFFDVDGTFIWRQIPTGYNDNCIMDNSTLKDMIINEQSSYSFKEIYNVTEVWGKVLELEYNDRYCYEGITYVNNIYRLVLTDVSSLEDINHLTQIAIKIPATNLSGAKVQINDLSPIPLVTDGGESLPEATLKADTTYVFMYRRTLGNEIQNALYLLGQYQAYGIYKETNPNCPFSVQNLGYEIIHRVNYDNLYSDELCYNQAEYDTYKTTAILDTITLECIYIPWLDVNQKIEYTSSMTGLTNQYMIRSISCSTLDGTMNITLYRFLESFSYVKNRSKLSKERRI